MIDKTKEIIEQEYNDNIQKIHDLNYKARILKNNSIGKKFELCVALGMIPWVLITFTIELIIKSNIIPLELIQPLSIGIPALVGITGQQIIYKRNKIKEKLKEISKTISEKDLTMESTRYDLEKEKLYNKNEFLSKAYNNLEANQIFLKTYSDICEK